MLKPLCSLRKASLPHTLTLWPSHAEQEDLKPRKQNLKAGRQAFPKALEQGKLLPQQCRAGVSHQSWLHPPAPRTRTGVGGDWGWSQQ